MANYYELSLSFKNKKYYKYNKNVYCDGRRIIDLGVVIAEYISHKGREYAVLYNRSNKCLTSDTLYWINSSWNGAKGINVKYGELGKADAKNRYLGYRSQLNDALFCNGPVQYILVPTTSQGDSVFFKDL